eukprot:5705876-Prorocentrum_lima.AAC.1
MLKSHTREHLIRDKEDHIHAACHATKKDTCEEIPQSGPRTRRQPFYLFDTQSALWQSKWLGSE